MRLHQRLAEALVLGFGQDEHHRFVPRDQPAQIGTELVGQLDVQRARDVRVRERIAGPPVDQRNPIADRMRHGLRVQWRASSQVSDEPWTGAVAAKYKTDPLNYN